MGWVPLGWTPQQRGGAGVLVPGSLQARGRALLAAYLARVAHSDLWRYAVVPFLATRALLSLVAVLADFYILPLIRAFPGKPKSASLSRFPDFLWLNWQHLDSGFYLDLARDGYWPSATLNHLSNWVFFPLYPLLVHGLASLWGGSPTAYSLAGLAIANAATVVAFRYLYLLVARDFSRGVARLTVLYLALFPTSFYLSAIYPHSLTLAWSVAALYYGRARRWGPAGLCGGLAALTRLQGVLVLVPLAWDYWQLVSERYATPEPHDPRAPWARRRAWLITRVDGPVLAFLDRGERRVMASLALIPAGTLLFMGYAALQTGDPLVASHNEAHWGRTFGLPWTLLWQSLTHPALPRPLDWNFWGLNNLLALLFLAATVWAFRRLPTIYGIYSLVMVLAPLASGSMQSLGRYYVVVFPPFVLLALWSEGRPERSTALLCSFAALQALLMTFFVLALPAIG